VNGTFYKLLSQDLTAFGGYQWRIGGTHRPVLRKAKRDRIVTVADLNSGRCNNSVLYASRTIEDASRYAPAWPYRLFEVHGVPVVEGDDKAGFLQLRLGVELDVARVFGPNGAAVVKVLRRCERLTTNEIDQLSAARYTAQYAAWDAAPVAAWDAARDAARCAARDAAWYAARYAARDATEALSVADLVGQYGYTQEHHDMLLKPWITVIGKTWENNNE